jgi:thiamine monophosphate synthase
MIKPLKCPVYALGGMKSTDLNDALEAGSQGIAVSSFWK